MNARSSAFGVVLLLALGTLSACAGLPVASRDPAHAGPFYVPRNISGDPMLPAAIRRVVLLPIYAGQAAPLESAAALDQVVFASLQKQARFEVVTLSRDESRLWFGEAQFSSAGALPAGFLEKIALKFAADAVLFVDLTVYRPYRPLAVGFRSKLATTAEVRLVWSFDEVISAEDPAVANGARHQYLQTDRGGQPVDLSATALQSPGRFAAYAADAMFQTLPPR